MAVFPGGAIHTAAPIVAGPSFSFGMIGAPPRWAANMTVIPKEFPSGLSFVAAPRLLGDGGGGGNTQVSYAG